MQTAVRRPATCLTSLGFHNNSTNAFTTSHRNRDGHPKPDGTTFFVDVMPKTPEPEAENTGPQAFPQTAEAVSATTVGTGLIVRRYKALPLIRRFKFEGPVVKPANLEVDRHDAISQSAEHNTIKTQKPTTNVFRKIRYGLTDLRGQLQSTARTEGREGIARIWHELQASPWELSTKTQAGQTSWEIFLSNHELHHDIFEYAVRLRRDKGDTYLPLYKSILGHCLQISSDETLSWHEKFKQSYTIPRNGLRGLVKPALTRPKSRAHLVELHSDFHQHSDPMYDTIIIELCRRGLFAEALMWHSKLMECNDIPSIGASKHPIMKRFQLFMNQIASATLRQELAKPPVPSLPEPVLLETTATAPRTDNDVRFDRETMYSLLGQKHGIAPKSFSDEFCARLFATKAFSTGVVISSLRMFGIQSIGPLALREMAIREGGPTEIMAKLEDLFRSGISVGESVYSRAVVKLSTEGRDELLHSLLTSDQHPDVLEDIDLQKRLLGSYIAQDDWVSVHRTLMLLTLFHRNPAQESWNILLQHHLQNKHVTRPREAKRQARNIVRSVEEVITDMSVAGVQVTNSSINAMFRQLLAPRRFGRRPVTRPKIGSITDDLSFITNLLFQIMNSGQRLPADCWRELIRRFGMMGRFESLARLCSRLVFVYSPTRCGSQVSQSLIPSPTSVFRRESSLAPYHIDPHLASTLKPSHPAHPYRQVFRDVIIQAIVAWGFQLGRPLLQDHPARRQYNASLKDPRHDMPWPLHIKPPPLDQVFLRGIALIHDLQSNGVFISVDAVKSAVRQRLWQLFSPNFSWRLVNRRAQLVNPYRLEEVLKGVLDTWKGPTLFPELLIDDSKQGKHVDLESASSEVVPKASPDLPVFAHEAASPLPEPRESIQPTSNITSDPYHVEQEGEEPRPRTILDDLANSTNLNQQFILRKRMALVLFGLSPMLGHRRRGARRASSDVWDNVVTNWARGGGKGRFLLRNETVRATRNSNGKIVMNAPKVVRRRVGVDGRWIRNKIVVSGRGSVPLSELREKKPVTWEGGDALGREFGNRE